ncbi:MAG: AAA family ATPase [Candidatus Latescibacterota bacterium]|nr:AAA family ATPase [Candidatus Latescibacterota bacterium]
MTDARRKGTSRKSLDLFEAGRGDSGDQPLAARLRPRVLDEFVGQDHILGHGRLLRRAIQADQLSSLIFYGPPGTGKTTLALVIANTTKSHFITINAVLAGIADIRTAVKEAKERHDLYGHRTILFIDEVHRFNKAQQDALLPWVENGTVILIGATTENPYFSVNRPLVSRSRIFQLRDLEAKDLRRIVKQALVDPRGYGDRHVQIADDALEHLVAVCNGDARALLNAIELAVETTTAEEGVIHVTLGVAEESIQRRAVLYDKGGDYHFDTISAFIKSLRGSDPDATVYWLARMVYAGEDPQFILRRMVIFAGEDVGLADPNALTVVTAAAEAFDRVGLPEGRFHLAEAALYLATAPKSNSTFAFFDALAAVEAEGDGEVPNHLKDASRDAEGLGHGANYLYPHAYRDHWVAQQYLPDSLHGRIFYEPSNQGHEHDIGDRVRRRRELQLAAVVEGERVHAEALTRSPDDRRRDQWLVRAAGELSGQLDHVRQRVFASLQLARHHVVLDVDAASGLLTWEAIRRVPEGSVWALCTDRTAAVGVREMASQHLDELDRPIVLDGPITRVTTLVGQQEDGDVRFDAIIGRNAFGDLEQRETAIRAIAGLLAPGGAISFAETVPRRSQRLTDLVKLDALGDDLSARVLQAEEDIYADPSDPRVTWEPQELAAMWASAGVVDVEVEMETLRASRRLSSQHLGSWFNPGGEKHRTFASFLRRHLDDAELKRVRYYFEEVLLNRDVQWSTTYAYVRGKAAD